MPQPGTAPGCVRLFRRRAAVQVGSDGTFSMLLTKCASCAAELGLTSGKKCGRCQTRYCGPACQKKHWEEGGHDQLCRKIKRDGGAEQFYANTKYAEAVSVAAEACAEDTKGQTCYICTQALHWKTKEGLVRMCACRGTAGFAHVSCLAEQAKLLCDEAEENNLDMGSRWERWYLCSLCEQDYHGVVSCALGWACWKTYVGRPETDQVHVSTMNRLGNGLSSAGHHADALPVREAELATLRRLGASEDNLFAVQGNLASTVYKLGRFEDALRIERGVYSGRSKFLGEEHPQTLLTANNYADSLHSLHRFEEAKSVLRKIIPVARRVFGDSHELTLRMRTNYARSLYKDDGATLDDLREAVTTLEDTERTARRVLGGTHPFTMDIETTLQNARSKLASFDALAEGVRDLSVS